MSIEPSNPADDHHVAKLFGAMLMVVGVLIMTLCGICSAGVLVMAIFAATQSLGSGLGLLGTDLVVGGLPFGVGLVIFIVGKGLRREPPPRSS
ncbi:MAG: hypothetical protein P4L73_11280 [Caulobacteraceae bacterium]|nr:hypothetical protein [Caulobacteraceae bacterium]